MMSSKRKAEENATKSLEKARSELHSPRMIATDLNSARAAVLKTKTVFQTTAHVLKVANEVLEQHQAVCQEKCCKLLLLLLAAHDPRDFELMEATLYQSELAVALSMLDNRIDEVSKLISQATELSEKNEYYAGPLPQVPEEVKPSSSSGPPSARPWEPADGM